jgi:hypothetical protein
VRLVVEVVREVDGDVGVLVEGARGGGAEPELPGRRTPA